MKNSDKNVRYFFPDAILRMRTHRAWSWTLTVWITHSTRCVITHPFRCSCWPFEFAAPGQAGVPKCKLTVAPRPCKRIHRLNVFSGIFSPQLVVALKSSFFTLRTWSLNTQPFVIKDSLLLLRHFSKRTTAAFNIDHIEWHQTLQIKERLLCWKVLCAWQSSFWFVLDSPRTHSIWDMRAQQMRLGEVRPLPVNDWRGYFSGYFQFLYLNSKGPTSLCQTDCAFAMQPLQLFERLLQFAAPGLQFLNFRTHLGICFLCEHRSIYFAYIIIEFVFDRRLGCYENAKKAERSWILSNIEAGACNKVFGGSLIFSAFLSQENIKRFLGAIKTVEDILTPCILLIALVYLFIFWSCYLGIGL